MQQRAPVGRIQSLVYGVCALAVGHPQVIFFMSPYVEWCTLFEGQVMMK